MLTFEKTDNTYKVIEQILGFNDTKTKIVEYSLDLSKVRVNNDPWRETSEGQKNWFNKYMRKHFEERE